MYEKCKYAADFGKFKPYSIMEQFQVETGVLNDINYAKICLLNLSANQTVLPNMHLEVCLIVLCN